MKIAFVNQPWNRVELPIRSGSIAIWIYEVARRLAKSHEITVYARKDSGQKSVEHSEGVEYRRIRVSEDMGLQRVALRVPKLGGALRFDHWAYYFGYIHRIALDLRKQGADIIHIHNLSHFAPIVRRLNSSANIVLHMHCEWLTQIDPTIVRKRMDSVDWILGCSEYIVETIDRVFPERTPSCRAVLNGVDLKRFSPPENGRARSKQAKKILFVGRVSPEKGVHVLIQAISKVVAAYPEVGVEIVGGLGAAPREFIVDGMSDPLVAGISRMFTAHYVADLERSLLPEHAGRVRFLGELPYGELPNRYRAADVLVVPSVWNEPFGLPAVEAMACGLPVVAARSGGLTEIVEDGVTGILVERGDAGSLAEALILLLGDPELCDAMGRAGRARAERVFSWDSVAKGLSTLYRAGGRSTK